MDTIGPVLAVLIGSVVIFLAAVWFGRTMLASRISRAADRIDRDDEEPRDRAD
jgi:hypothetical protein